MNRRAFFSELIRYLLLAAIGTVSAAAMIKGRQADRTHCPPGLACQTCGQSARCTMPRNRMPSSQTESNYSKSGQ